MQKKYQIFISSTFDDLQEERKTVIEEIQSMLQFPVGMEMFTASDQSQWDIIKPLLDSTDYVVLILGMVYGSTIQDGEFEGISYTEREYRYAIENKIPVLPFVISNEANIPAGMLSKAGENSDKLERFKKDVMKIREVQFWKSPEDLGKKVSTALYKEFIRVNRPGWVRTTEFDIDKSMAEITRLTERVHTLEALNSDLKLQNNRRPDLIIQVSKDSGFDNEWEQIYDKEVSISDNEIHFTVKPVSLSDIDVNLKYKDEAGMEKIASKQEVMECRYLCKNGFQLCFHVCNIGTAKATGIRATLSFPEGLLITSISELYDFIGEDPICFSKDAYENWEDRFLEPEDSKIEKTKDHLFLSKDQLFTNEEIADVLDPAVVEEGYTVFPQEVTLQMNEVKHKDSEWFRGIYIVPTAPGEYTIKCHIMCNELIDATEQEIKVVID